MTDTFDDIHIQAALGALVDRFGPQAPRPWEDMKQIIIRLADGVAADVKRDIFALRADLARLQAENGRLRELIGDTQDFLKILITGDSQYRFGDRIMANGMAHAEELDAHLKQALTEPEKESE